MAMAANFSYFCQGSWKKKEEKEGGRGRGVGEKEDWRGSAGEFEGGEEGGVEWGGRGGGGEKEDGGGRAGEFEGGEDVRRSMRRMRMRSENIFSLVSNFGENPLVRKYSKTNLLPDSRGGRPFMLMQMCWSI